MSGRVDPVAAPPGIGVDVSVEEATLFGFLALLDDVERIGRSEVA